MDVDACTHHMHANMYCDHALSGEVYHCEQHAREKLVGGQSTHTSLPLPYTLSKGQSVWAGKPQRAKFTHKRNFEVGYQVRANREVHSCHSCCVAVAQEGKEDVINGTVSQGGARLSITSTCHFSR